jgi:hypothetical protein
LARPGLRRDNNIKIDLIEIRYSHVYGVTIDGVLDWILDLLTTYTHDSEQQVITAPSLISILYKSPQHTPSLLQPAVSSPAIRWCWLLTGRFFSFCTQVLFSQPPIRN